MGLGQFYKFKKTPLSLSKYHTPKKKKPKQSSGGLSFGETRRRGRKPKGVAVVRTGQATPVSVPPTQKPRIVKGWAAAKEFVPSGVKKPIAKGVQYAKREVRYIKGKGAPPYTPDWRETAGEKALARSGGGQVRQPKQPKIRVSRPPQIGWTEWRDLQFFHGVSPTRKAMQTGSTDITTREARERAYRLAASTRTDANTQAKVETHKVGDGTNYIVRFRKKVA